jgi:tRNA(Ile)-lysidine synthase
MRVVAGVSGGIDSVCMLQLLRDLAPEYSLELHVVHLDHMLRPESGADAAFVRQLAGRAGLPVTVGHARVGAIAGRLGIGIEEAGRLARYRLLETVADRIGARRIAVGHHQDDQVETVLLNIVRGAGPGGLAGMRPRRGRVVRPLLSVSREEIAAYCRAAGLEWRTDESNSSPEFLRNRIRHHLLPLLRKEFNPRIDQAILRLAEIAGEEHRWLGRHARFLLRRLLAEAGDERRGRSGRRYRERSWRWQPRERSGVRLSLHDFERLPLVLRRRLLREAVRQAGGSLRRLGYQNVEDCLDFLSRGTPGRAVQLPDGMRVSKTSGSFTVAVQDAPSTGGGGRPGGDRARRAPGTAPHPGSTGAPDGRAAPVPLLVPGETSLGELGLTIRARVVDIAPSQALYPFPADDGGGRRACFDYEKLEKPLAVRTRRPGDRLQPFGMQGTKKLKKLLGELGVPGGERSRIALVTSNDQIIWIAGYRRAQAAPVTGQTRQVLILEAERLQSANPGSGPSEKN